MRKEKGITLITLIVSICIIIIISSMLIYNAKTAIKVRKLNMMQNDIDILSDKVSAYYIKYNALPLLMKYDIDSLSDLKSYINPNDSEDGYYVLDLKVFDGLVLNYGYDYNNEELNESNVMDFKDLYIINEQSHQIYYVNGIEMDGIKYYTNDSSQKIDLIEIEHYCDIDINVFLDTYNKTLGTVPFIFRVTGEKDGTIVYDNVVNILFDSPGNKKLTINNVGVEGTVVTVTEEYSGGNYKLISNDSMTVTLSKDTNAEVQFNQTYDGKINTITSVNNILLYDRENNELILEAQE